MYNFHNLDLDKTVRAYYKKNLMKLLILSSKHEILVNEHFHELQPFFKARVVMENTIILKIRRDVKNYLNKDFNKILKDETDLKKKYINKSKQNLQLQIDRLIEFRLHFTKEINKYSNLRQKKFDPKIRHIEIQNFKINYRKVFLKK